LWGRRLVAQRRGIHAANTAAGLSLSHHRRYWAHGTFVRTPPSREQI